MPTLEKDGVDEKHDEIAKQIGDKVPHLAQSFVDDVKVSLVRKHHIDKFYHSGPLMASGVMRTQMMIDVATGEGGAIASDAVFQRSFAAFVIDDLRRWPKKIWPGKHRDADALEQLTIDKPSLFF